MLARFLFVYKIPSVQNKIYTGTWRKKPLPSYPQKTKYIPRNSLIAKKSENAVELLKKIVPFQGYLGIALLVYGVYTLITGVIGGISILSMFPLWWITMLAVSVVEIVLGFMLVFGLISKYALSKNETAKEKGDLISAKLGGYQSTLGLIGIGVGIWTVIY